MGIEDKLDMSLGDMIKSQNKANKQKKKKKPAPQQKKKASKGFIAHVAKLRKNMEEKGRKPKGVYEDDQQKAARLKKAAKARKTYIEARNLLRKKRRTE